MLTFLFSHSIFKFIGHAKEEIVWKLMWACPGYPLEPMLLQQCVQTLLCSYQMLGCSLLPSFATVSVSMQRVTSYNSFASTTVTIGTYIVVKGTWPVLPCSCICCLRRGVGGTVMISGSVEWGVCRWLRRWWGSPSQRIWRMVELIVFTQFCRH